ncbi:hypothetical protein HYQ44_000935 [Verticillium longisporum]|nr:hypothetical protein HYQ44_000935 [Verticillium longisporum]
MLNRKTGSRAGVRLTLVRLLRPVDSNCESHIGRVSTQTLNYIAAQRSTPISTPRSARPTIQSPARGIIDGYKGGGRAEVSPLKTCPPKLHHKHPPFNRRRISQTPESKQMDRFASLPAAVNKVSSCR